MNRFTYEELKIGRTEEFDVTVTQDMLNAFCRITDDTNPLHCDDLFPIENGFEGRVAYGMLTASFLSTLAGVYLPGEKSLIQSVEIKFTKPVYIGDKLCISGRVDELNDTVRQIVLKVEIKKNDGTKVLRGKMKVGVLGER